MIFVTGGTGLVGSHILLNLIASGKPVRALYRHGSDFEMLENLLANHGFRRDVIEWIEGDVNDLLLLDDALKGVEEVYHSAALVSFYPSDRKRMMKINVEGTANMVNMSMKNAVKRFCHVSSVATLDRSISDSLIDESSLWKSSPDNSNYAMSKYGGEREVWRAMEEGLSAFIVNPSIVIGPGSWKSGSTQMFSQVYKGLQFYVTGTTGFVDVRDVASSVIKLMNMGVSGERFILNSENLPYRVVFDAIAENLSKPRSRFRVNSFLCELGWRLERIRGLIMNDNPMITKETARSGLTHRAYSNQKIKNATGIDFILISKSIRDASVEFLKHVEKHRH